MSDAYLDGIASYGDIPPAEERKARRVHVFKCPKCGREERLDEEDMVRLKGVFCGDFSCSNDYCKEDRIEIEDADGNITAVII